MPLSSSVATKGHHDVPDTNQCQLQATPAIISSFRREWYTAFRCSERFIAHSRRLTPLVSVLVTIPALITVDAVGSAVQVFSRCCCCCCCYHCCCCCYCCCRCYFFVVCVAGDVRFALACEVNQERFR